MTATYLNLLNPDGSVNRVVFEQILASRVLNEINLRLCGSAGLRAPSTLSLGEIAEWRRQKVAEKNLGPIHDAERRRIANDHRRELAEWTHAMQAAAAKQREVMGELPAAAE